MSTKRKPAWETELLSCSIYKSVKLKCDGHKLTVQAGIHKNRIVYSWFLDGVWKGEYMNMENEIGAKFGFMKTVRVPPTVIKLIERTYGKKVAEAKKKERILCGYLNYWGSLRSLAAHLKKTCSQIEIITEE